MKTKLSHTKGFIALVSSLVISAILIVLMFTTGTGSFYSRFDSLTSENKRISLGLAESCIHYALLALATSTSPSSYSPINKVVSVDTDAQGNPMNCTIERVTTVGTVATIDVQAVYKGSFSNVTAKATVQNPLTAPVAPPPTCALTANPSPVPQGQSVLLQWGTANATSFTLDKGVGVVTPTDSGSKSVTAAGAGSVTYTGTATGLGGSTQCTATFVVNPPPPNPGCADTVMVLDRTGSMTSTDRANERSAATALVNLYGAVSTKPKVGVGSFGGYPNSSSNPASIPTNPNGQLQNTYTTLLSTIATLTGSNSSVGSNLAAGITVAVNELKSIRATAPKKVIIFVSDGEPSEPTGNLTSDTQAALTAADTAKNAGIELFTVRYSQDTSQAGRTLMAQLASGNVAVSGHQPGSDDSSFTTTNTSAYVPTATHSPNNWRDPSFAFLDDTKFATSSVSGEQQGYSNFNISIPGGATINGITVNLDGKVQPGTLTTSLPASTEGNYKNWSVSSGNKINAVNGDDNSPYISTAGSNNAQTFVITNSGVPSGSTINSVTVSVKAKSQNNCSGSNCPSIAIRAEKGTGSGNQNDSTSASLSGSYFTYSRVYTVNPFTNTPWTVSEVNNWTTRFGVIKTNSNGTAQVTYIVTAVNYTPPISTCSITAALSWNNGSNWSNSKTVTLSGAQTVFTLGGSTDKWGSHSWNQGEFSNSNFVFRLSNTSCTGGNIAAVNYAKVMINYSGYNPTVENNDGDNFFITPLSASEMQQIFNTIGTKVCPAAAAQCGNTVDDDGDGLVDTNDPVCHTDKNASNAASYDKTINDEWGTPPAPPAPPLPPPPPPNINLGSWEEVPN